MATFNSELKVWDGEKVDYPFANDTSVGAEILKNLAATPERILNICHDDETSMTCEETRLNSIRIAQHLTKLGYKAGDNIGIICTNSTYLPPTLYACLLIGAPINPLDVAFKKDDIVQMFGQTKPKLVFCDSDVYETVKEAIDELKSDAVICTLRDVVEGVPFIAELIESTSNESDFIAPNLGPATEALSVILCSSGTTGAAKGVCLSHAHILSYLKMFKEPEALRSLSFSPIYWSTGLISTIMVAFRQQDTRIITTQSFNIELLMELVKRYEVNFVQAAPYQLALLLQSPMFDPRAFMFVKVFYVLGSMVSEHLRKEFQDALPRHPLVIGYSMSESCISISQTKPGDSIEGLTVGRISPNVQVKIVDKEGNALDAGVTGEILAKPEFEFMGYYENIEASKSAVDNDGFLLTGDIGFVDENGCVFIIDRKKEIMKYKGYQINPSEIENVIQAIEGVEMVSVVGIPDKTGTNLIAAVIVRRPEFEEDLKEEMVIDYITEKLPNYKHLHGGVHFVDELPMTPSGKVQKRFVKAIAVREHAQKLKDLELYNSCMN